MKYLLLGGKGLVLSRFNQLNKGSTLPVLDFPEIDITDYNNIVKYISSQQTDDLIVVLGAAYTDVDGAEKEKGSQDGQVYRINVLGPKNVAKICQSLGIFLIYISTDFVFAGTEGNKGPYKEDEKPVLDEQNMGWYGQTKFLGEKAVGSFAQQYAILRISYPYRSSFTGKGDFARNILNLFDQKKLYPMFSDQYMTPTFIDEATEVIKKLAEKRLKGVFHCASSNTTTPYEFASYLLEKARGVQGIVKESSMVGFRKNFPDKAPRPQYGGLKCEETKKILGLKFMTWEEQINELVRQMNTL